MGKIVLLDELTINQIAAGEVIERPANVVKELVENSIDAGADKIIIEIKNGGKTYIRVTDNGKGISNDDMELAFERHATSKIRKIEDLNKIYSMGFRGEALASIASISKVTMISKTDEEMIGRKLVNEAGKIIEVEESGTKTGTTIIVENLFFNIPVRFKFLKQDGTEFRYIKDIVEKISLANEKISIQLVNDDKVIYKTNGNGKIEDIIYLLYGKEIEENIVNIDYVEDNIKITGVIGNTLIAREDRRNQIIFLNKRFIKNKVISNSADQAFKGATGIGKYGFFILNIEMSPELYDVNVHPTKMEVRFKEDVNMYRIIYHAIKNSMLNNKFLGNEEKGTSLTPYVDKELSFLTNHFVNNQEENQQIQKNTIERAEKRKIEYKYIGILFRTYIIIEIGDELYFIDQHAAHERILYEQIKENYKNNVKNNSQLLLIPEVVNLSHKEMEFTQKYMQVFQKIGFDLEIFGDNSIKINGIPELDYKTSTKRIFLDILDEMMTGERGFNKDIEERFLATVACKVAVKANMDLSIQEVDYLIQNLLILNNPFTCPHGRPTTIKFTKEELKT